MITLHSLAATDSMPFLKILASKGEHSRASLSTGGKYRGTHLSSSFLFERTFFMLHSRMQDTCSKVKFESKHQILSSLVCYLRVVLVHPEWVTHWVLMVKVALSLCGPH